MSSLSFISMLKALSSVRVKSKNWFFFRKKTTPSGFRESERKQFTDLESIKVDALYNSHQIKKRKSFVVSADCILQESEIAGQVAENDPSRKIGCVLKPAQSMRDVMTPTHNTQTWHKKSSAPSSVSSSSGVKKRLEWSHKRSQSSASTIPSGNGVRNAFALEQSLEALEQVQAEMKDLKQVIEDAESFKDQPQLQRSIAILAGGKKQATLRDKLNNIFFEGDDAHVFHKLKGKLSITLDRLTKDWSLGGLDLSQAPKSCSGSLISSRAPSRISSMASSRISSRATSVATSAVTSAVASAASSNTPSRASSRSGSIICCQSEPRSSRPSTSSPGGSMRSISLRASDAENCSSSPSLRSEPRRRNNARVFVGTTNTEPVQQQRRVVKVNLAAALDKENVAQENVKVDV